MLENIQVGAYVQGGGVLLKKIGFFNGKLVLVDVQGGKVVLV